MKIFKNFIMNSSYQILLIILPIVTAPYISRVLGVEGIGMYSYVVNIVQYFVIFSILGTVTYGNREVAYFQDDILKRSQTFWEISFLSWFTSGISIVCFFIFILIDKSNTVLYILQGISILTSMLDISWYFSGRERFNIIVLRNFVIKILTVVFIFLFVKKADDLTKYIAIMSISGLLGSISLWPFLKNEVIPPVVKNLKVFKHLKPTLVLFLPTVAVSFYSLINKLLIGQFDSKIHLGFYTQSDTILKMALSILTALMTVMLPRVSNMFARGDLEGIKKITEKTFNLSSGFSIGVCAGISSIALGFAPFFFGNQFSMVGLILIIESPLVVAISWNYIFGGQYLLPMNRMKIYTGSAVLGAVVSVLLNIAVIPFYGIIGATVVTVVSEFVVSFYQLYHIKNEFNLLKMFSELWKYVLAALGMFIIVFYMNQTFEMTIFQLLLQIFIGVLVYLILNILLDTEIALFIKSLVKKFKN